MDITVQSNTTEYLLPNKLHSEVSSDSSKRGYKALYEVVDKPNWITDIEVIKIFEVYNNLKFYFEPNITSKNREGVVRLRQVISGKILELNFTQSKTLYNLSLSNNPNEPILSIEKVASTQGDTIVIPINSYKITDPLTLDKVGVPVSVSYYSGNFDIVESLKFPNTVSDLVDGLGEITIGINRNLEGNKEVNLIVSQNYSNLTAHIIIKQSETSIIFKVKYNDILYNDLSIDFNNLNEEHTIEIISKDSLDNSPVGFDETISGNSDPMLFEISKIGSKFVLKLIKVTIEDVLPKIIFTQLFTGNTARINLNYPKVTPIFEDKDKPGVKEITLTTEDKVGATIIREIISKADKIPYIDWFTGAINSSPFWGDNPPEIPEDQKSLPTWNTNYIRVSKLSDNTSLVFETLTKNNGIEDIVNKVVITQEESNYEIIYTVIQPNNDPEIPFTVSKVEYDSDNNNILVYFTTEATSASSKAEMEYRSQESSSTGTKVNVTLGDLSYESTPGSNTWTKLVPSADKYDISVYNKNNLRATLPADFGTNTFVQISILLNKQGNKPTYLIAKLNK